MALIKCPECGQEISDQANTCPNCGYPVSNIPVTEEKYIGFWSVGRLTIGIISIMLSVFIAIQSVIVGIGNTLSGNGETSGSIGLIFAVLMLTAGIVGMCTRNMFRRSGPVITCILYWTAFTGAYGEAGNFTDLEIWSIVAFGFGIVFLICAIKRRA